MSTAPLGSTFKSGGTVYTLKPNVLCSRTVKDLLLLKKRRLDETWELLMTGRQILKEEDFNDKARDLMDERIALSRSADIRVALEMLHDQESLPYFVLNSCDGVKDLEHAIQIVDNIDSVVELLQLVADVANETTGKAKNSSRPAKGGPEKTSKSST